jgi:hypothetical protein
MAKLTRAEKRQIAYNVLIQNGFTATEARQYRDRSLESIENLLKSRNEEIRNYNQDKDRGKDRRRLIKVSDTLNTIQRTKVNTSGTYNPKKPRGIQYESVKNAPKNYLSKYTYLVRYRKGIKRGNRFFDVKEDWVTITGNTKLFKFASTRDPQTGEVLLGVIPQVIQTYYDGETTKYNPEQIILSSIEIVEAYEAEF